MSTIKKLYGVIMELSINYTLVSNFFFTDTIVKYNYCWCNN